jgi:hypothetical protein
MAIEDARPSRSSTPDRSLGLSAVWSRNELSPAAWVTLIIAAVAVAVGGYLHGHLYHEGYSRIDWVGILFLLNAIASGVVIALLALGRALAFTVGGLAISAGSLVSILISHSTSFFGFAEHRFDSRATAIVAAEIAAIVLLIVACAIARAQLLAPAPATTGATA